MENFSNQEKLNYSLEANREDLMRYIAGLESEKVHVEQHTRQLERELEAQKRNCEFERRR